MHTSWSLCIGVVRPSRRGRWPLLRMSRSSMAYADPPHPEERSRERVSKDAESQLRDDFPLHRKARFVHAVAFSAGATKKPVRVQKITLESKDGKPPSRHPNATRRNPPF